MTSALPCRFMDTHVHLDLYDPERELSGVLERARAAGVDRLLAIGGNTGGNCAAVEAAQQPGVWAAVGYDRDQAGGEIPRDQLVQWLANPRVVAVGEIGLDYHYHPESVDAQKQLMEEMLALAREHHRPVVVHSREADADTLELLARHAGQWTGPSESPGVLHCFTGGLEFAQSLLAQGWMISFSGILTFRNAEALRKVAPLVPDDRLLIETDSPFLAPVPHRGQKNEPAFVVAVAERLAELRGQSLASVAELTRRNAERLFGLARE